MLDRAQPTLNSSILRNPAARPAFIAGERGTPRPAPSAQAAPFRIHRLGRDFGAAANLTRGAIRAARQQGYRAVLDLRAGLRLSPFDAAAAADEAWLYGLAYRHQPFAGDHAGPEDVDALIDVLEELPRPVLIACADGRLAMAAGLLAQGGVRQAGLLFARASALGMPLEDPSLRAVLRAWFETRDRLARA